jgi:hypothetical protein
MRVHSPDLRVVLFVMPLHCNLPDYPEDGTRKNRDGALFGVRLPQNGWLGPDLCPRHARSSPAARDASLLVTARYLMLSLFPLRRNETWPCSWPGSFEN